MLYKIVEQLLIPIFIAILIFVVFYHVLNSDFVNWDDDLNYVNNLHYRGLGWQELKWMFTEPYAGHYTPINWLTFGLDYDIWGMNAKMYHFSSLLWHIVAAMAFYFLALKLLRLGAKNAAYWSILAGAVFAALVFGLHPLRAEPVGWLSTRRDILAGLFYILSISAYLSWVESKKRTQWFIASLCLFLLALLSKAVTVTLPATLLILDFYPLRRRAYLEKVPFIILAAATVMIAFIYANHKVAATLEDLNFAKRFLIAIYGFGFYMEKTFLPFNLSPLYQLFGPQFHHLWSADFILAYAIAVILFLVALYYRSRIPALISAFSIYAVTLIPLSGIFQVGPQIAADRYTYIPCMAWAVLAGAGLTKFYGLLSERKIKKWIFVSVVTAAILIIVLFGILTRQQINIWRNSETLWRHAIKVDQLSSIAHLNLGSFLASEGRVDEAKQHFKTALEIDPQYKRAYVNLAIIFEHEGKPDEAVAYYLKAIEIDPKYALAYYNLGISFAKNRNFKDAIHYFEIALSIDSGSEPAKRALEKARELDRTR